MSNLPQNEDSPPQTIALTGISSGAADESQTLTVTATNSNPALVTNLNVTYASPAGTGTLAFALLPNASGSATITVTVNDGGSSNNIISRSFTVTVNPPLRIQSIARQPTGSVTIGFQGIPGALYTIEASSDLMGWSSIGTATEGAPGQFQFEDTGAAGLAARFYRLRAI